MIIAAAVGMMAKWVQSREGERFDILSPLGVGFKLQLLIHESALLVVCKHPPAYLERL